MDIKEMTRSPNSIGFEQSSNIYSIVKRLNNAKGHKTGPVM